MVKSPCIDVCEIDPQTEYCRGCYRSLNEIANWSNCSDSQQRQIIDMANTRKYSNKAGFTLLELAISMGVVALIIGAVLVAQNYIQAAGIRKQTVQLEGIQSAVQLFQSKYQCMPGDCADPTIISGYTYTGNGNGYLESTWNDNENKGFWIHLVQAKMLIDPLVDHGVLSGMQTERMAINQAGIINALGNLTTAQNVLILGTGTVTGALSLLEITSLDQKLDDGIAASGIVRSTGFGTGSTTIYSGTPFPLSINNDGGSAQCISAGLYAETSTKCNMVFILSQ